MNTPRLIRAPALGADEMEGILNDLTKLNLGDRQALADRTNVAAAVRHAKADAKNDSGLRANPKEVITVSDGSENKSVPPPFLTPKAHRLEKLCRNASEAADNVALAGFVKEFIEVLQSNKSRMLTKEAFRFLDVLYKQLADPSVFIQPLR